MPSISRSPLFEQAFYPPSSVSAISERTRIGALWFLGVASLFAGLMEWRPYAHARYDAQFFFGAVGLMSGFFVAWCCIAIGMWINARRVAR